MNIVSIINSINTVSANSNNFYRQSKKGKVNCPNCGFHVKIEDKKTLTCGYCGHKFKIQK